MDTMLPPETERIEAGRQLGHDYYRRSRLYPDASWNQAMCEGYFSAEASRYKRNGGDRFVRKWLQLRASALRRSRIVDSQVTPLLLMQLDVAICPVLRRPLTHGSQEDSDWSVDRLNNDGAYAPRNLAIISTLANRAKADHSFQFVHEQALGNKHVSGLAPQEWMRLASLMLGPCFISSPGGAPILPLLTPLPLATVRSATQLIQYVLTLHTRSAAEKNRVIKEFGRVCTHAHARVHLNQVAERIHLELKTTAVMWDVWNSPRVMQFFLGWRSSMSAYAWARLGETAMELSGGRHVSLGSLSGWHLRTTGHFKENWRAKI